MFKSVIIKLTGIVLAVIISQSGCSVIGFGAGCLKDARMPDSLRLEGREINKAKTGKDIVVTLKNGNILQGKFGGIQHLSSQEYEVVYNKCFDNLSDSLYLPHYGDSIDILLTSGKTLRRRFVGFDYRFEGARLSQNNALPAYLSIGSLNNTLIGKVYLFEIEKITGQDGGQVEGNVVVNLVQSSMIPFYSYIVIYNQEATKKIALDEIDYVSMPNSKHNKYYGLAMGAALDVLVVIVASNMTYDLGDWDWDSASWKAIAPPRH